MATALRSRIREETTPIYPLENGDRLSRDEFERRYRAMPKIKKAELIRGVVYMPSCARLKKRKRQHAPLENGDRLTRAEFEQRYDALPELKKAELIKGVVYVPSPARLKQHGEQQGCLITWLGVYRVHTPGVELGDNTTVRLDDENEPQPDGLLRVAPGRGGQSRTSKGGYLEGAPELAAEVAASSASYDLHDKLDVFRRAGVREYIVWRVLDEELDWFVLRAKRYVKLKLDSDGLFRSKVFPGLWLDVAAMLRDDMMTVLRRLQEGLSSPEHAAFVKKLAKRSS